MPVLSPQEIYDILTDADFDTQVTYTVPDSSTYDPTTGDVTDNNDTDHTVQIVPPAAQKYYKSGEVVEDGDQVIYFSSQGLSFTPEQDMGHSVTIQSRKWKVVRVNTYEVGDETIGLYEVGLKR